MLRRKIMMKRMLFVVFVVLSFVQPIQAENADRYPTLLAEGLTSLNQKNLSAALQQFEAAIAADAKGVEAHYYLGVTRARANKDKMAEGHFLKALEIDRTFLPARLDLGVLYYQTGKDQKAMEAFKAVEIIDPGRARVHYYQGLILRRTGSAAASRIKLEKKGRIAGCKSCGSDSFSNRNSPLRGGGF